MAVYKFIIGEESISSFDRILHDYLRLDAMALQNLRGFVD